MTAPKRLEFILSSGLAIGGLERLFFHLARRLDARKLDVHVRLVGASGTFADWVLHELPGRARWYGRDLASLRSLRKDLRGTHVVHASGLFARGLTLALCPSAALVDTVANPDLEHSRSRQLAYWAIGRRQATYWADCEARADAGIAKFGIPRERVRVIYPGVERPMGTIDRADVLRQWQLPANARVVVAVGNLRRVKGHDRAIQLAETIRAKREDVWFLFAGADLSHGDIPERVEASAAKDRIRLLGFVPDPLPLLAAADVVLQPSRSEGVPRVLLEAMSVQATILATRVGGIPEVIEHGSNGLLCGDEELNALLEKLLADDQLRRRLGKNALATVMERFSMDRMIREFESMYLAAAASHEA